MKEACSSRSSGGVRGRGGLLEAARCWRSYLRARVFDCRDGVGGWRLASICQLVLQ